MKYNCNNSHPPHQVTAITAYVNIRASFKHLSSSTVSKIFNSMNKINTFRHSNQNQKDFVITSISKYRIYTKKEASLPDWPLCCKIRMNQRLSMLNDLLKESSAIGFCNLYITISHII